MQVMLMNIEQRTHELPNDRNREPNKGPPRPAIGTETEQKGGKEPAQRQAERDWHDSPKDPPSMQSHDVWPEQPTQRQREPPA